MFLEKKFQKEFLGDRKLIIEGLAIRGLGVATRLILSSLLSLVII
jgi:hypothetical protein